MKLTFSIQIDQKCLAKVFMKDLSILMTSSRRRSGGSYIFFGVDNAAAGYDRLSIQQAKQPALCWDFACFEI